MNGQRTSVAFCMHCTCVYSAKLRYMRSLVILWARTISACASGIYTRTALGRSTLSGSAVSAVECCRISKRPATPCHACLYHHHHSLDSLSLSVLLKLPAIASRHETRANPRIRSTSHTTTAHTPNQTPSPGRPGRKHELAATHPIRGAGRA
jgi:hypothetical protein